MSERATVTQVTQIGAETTPGTAVAASKRLQAIEVAPDIKANVTIFRPQGFKWGTVQAEGKEWIEAAISGQPTYDELIYPLSSLLKTVTPTTPGGGSSSRQWQYDPSSTAEDTVTTYTVQKGSPVTRAEQFAYGLFTALGLTFDRDKVELKGSMLGQQLADGIQLSTNEKQTVAITGTPTGGTFTLTFGGQTTAGIAYNAIASAVQTALVALSSIGAGNVVVTGGPGPGTAWVVEFRGALAMTDVAAFTKNAGGLTGGTSPDVTITETIKGVAPTSIALVPILPNQIDVFVDTTSGGLGGTKLTRLLKGDLQLSNRFGPLWAVNSANSSWVTHVELAPKGELSLLVEADAEGMGLLTPVRDGSTRYVRILATGAVIESAITYKLQIDLAVKAMAPKSFSDTDGVYAIEWTFEIVHDASWGHSQIWTLINTSTAL